MRKEFDWRNMTRRQYLYAIFTFSSLLLISFSYSLYSQSAEIERRDHWVTHSYEVLRLTRRLYTSVLDIETGQRGYLLTGTASFLRPYDRARSELDGEWTALQKATLDNEPQRATVEEIGPKLTEYKNLTDQQIQLYRKRGISGLSKQDMYQARTAMEQLRGLLDTVNARELGLLQDRLAQSRHEQTYYTILLVVGSFLALLGLLLANFMIFLMQSRQRGTEARLHSYEERLGLVLEGVNDGIYDYNPETRIMDFSPGYRALLGYDPEELNGPVERFIELVHPDDADGFRTNVRAYLHGETPNLTHVFRMRHRVGSWKWVLSRGVAVWNEKGEAKRLVGTHTDITQQKMREEELQQMNQELESFAYIASHDLRSPLVNLKGFAGEIEYALNEAMPALDPAIHALSESSQKAVRKSLQQDIPESIGFIRSAVEKMDVLTTAILDMSRIGRRVYTNQEMSIEVLLKRCLDSLAYEINRQQIQVTVGPMPTLSSDPVALEQIFGNILDNAVKYLRAEVPGTIHISAYTLEHGYEFHIADNGRGISEADRQKVFDIFRRAGNVGEIRGAGMGMSYVKALVRKVGGRIWFRSVLNEGTTFSLFLPSQLAVSAQLPS